MTTISIILRGLLPAFCLLLAGLSIALGAVFYVMKDDPSRSAVFLLLALLLWRCADEAWADWRRYMARLLDEAEENTQAPQTLREGESV